MSGTRSDGAASWTLWLLSVLGLGGNIAALFLPVPSFVTLAAKDAVFATDLGGHEVTIRDPRVGKAERFPLVAVSDSFEAAVGRMKSGPAKLRIEIADFDPVDLDVSLPPGKRHRVSVELQPKFGAVNLHVRNARNDEQPVVADVKVGERPSERGSDLRLVGLGAGRHGVTAKANGYCDASTEVEARPRATVQARVPMSPVLAADEVARFILDWGEKPRDLDAHLILSEPSAPVDSVRVFWDAMEGRTRDGGFWATLDVDYCQSEGFETLTAYDRVDGRYRLAVHHYEDVGVGDLASSGAVVRLVAKDCSVREFRVPAACKARWWEVAELEIRGGSIISVRELGGCRDLPYPQSRRSLGEGIVKALLGIDSTVPSSRGCQQRGRS